MQNKVLRLRTRENTILKKIWNGKEYTPDTQCLSMKDAVNYYKKVVCK